MATVKELQAKFTSNASGMESAFTTMANKLDDIEKASSRAATSMEKNMSRGMTRVFKTGEGFKRVSGTLETISKKSIEMGSNLTNKITKPAMIAGGALAGITIGKGFGRLVEIDNAKAKLDGLGHSGKDVKGIMNNALESVKGTSFGLGEAATTASSAVAAGIEPGKELTRYLSLTGDAAAIAGTSMGEMGSIINKVQTSNKAYNGELQQLSERGIPIYQWIAKEANVTADAVFDMARDGEISSEMFLNAIETNIGGAAKKMGEKSFTAGLANMWAAVGRLGASFLDAGGKGGGFFSKMKPLMAEFTNSLDGMESTAAKWGESLGKAFEKIIENIRGIIGWYNSLDKNTQKLINSVMKWGAITLVTVGPILKIFGRLTGVIAAVFGPFGKFLQFIAKFSTASKSAEGAIVGITKVFPKLGAALGLITGPVGWITLGIIALGTAFVVAYKKSETFRNIVNKVVEGVKIAFGTITEVIKGFFQLFKGNGQDGVITLSKILPPNVVQGLTKFADTVKENFFIVIEEVKKFAKEIGGQLLEFWNEMGPSIQEGIQKALPVIKELGLMLGEIFKGVWTILKEVIGLIWNLTVTMTPIIIGVIKNTWAAVKQIISGALNVILGIIKIFTSIFTMDLELMWSGIKQIFIGAFNIIVGLLKTSFIGQIIALVIMFSANIKQLFVNMWNSIWGTVRDVTNWIWNKIKTVWDLVKSKTYTTYVWFRDFLFGIWQSVWGAIRDFATWIWNKVRNSWDAVRNKTLSTYTWIKNFLFNTWNNIWNTIKNAATWIWNKVRNTWDAVRNKTVSVYTWIKEFIYNIWNTIWNKIKNTTTWIWNKIRYTWDLIKNKTSGVFTSVWNTIKRLWGLIWGYIRDTINLIKNKIINTWDNIRDRMWEIVTSIKNNVVNKFKDMYNGAKTWLDRIKSYLIGIKDKMASAAADLGIGVANAAIRGLNKMINGINKISEGITDKKLIDPINEISGGSGTLGAKLSTGTGASKQVKTDSQGRLRHNTLATVNDKGPGNGKGRNGHQELIRNKNGSMFAPKGKDVLMNLRKGQSVISGRETQELSSAGLIPQFNSGTGALGKIAGKWGAKLANTKHQTENVAENASMAIDAAKTAGIKEGASALGHGMGNIMKWVDKPKELVETMMSKMGVNFDGIAGGTGKLVRGAYSKLIPNLIDKVKDMFSEVEGGDGDASWLLNGKYPQLQPFGKYIGMTMNGTDNHYGLDFGMPTGTKIRALTAGKITQAGWVNTGGGNQVELKEPGGKWFQWYMHMSKVFAKAGQNVSAGDVIGLSGNTGSSSTPHLHIQRMQGYPSNDTAVDPTDWLKSLTGGSSGSGKWKSTVKKALVLAGLPTSSSYVNAWLKQIQTESSGNPNAIGGTDGYNHGHASGLVQVKPTTFQSMKGKGMNDIMNPLHNLVAGMNWAKHAYGSNILGYIGKGHGYANGGIVNSPQMAWLAEGGFSESVISHDPSMKARSKVLYDKTGDMLGFNTEAEILKEVLEVLMQSKYIQDASRMTQERIANKNTDIYMDSRKIAEQVSRRQGEMYRNRGYSLGR
ncbi:peptidoglycan DD-metalloendopeptidase family protein [Mammaliicoccus lentus]|uniref:peptidoglycan DD-metalloendopeptidase family protein n=1 Tax=Mammaliicoccus lentus TaxID=42858 RepID=UPI0035120768